MEWKDQQFSVMVKLLPEFIIKCQKYIIDDG